MDEPWVRPRGQEVPVEECQAPPLPPKRRPYLLQDVAIPRWLWWIVIIGITVRFVRIVVEMMG